MTYSLDDILSALGAAHGADVTVRCQNWSLSEIWYHFHVSGRLQNGRFVPADPGSSTQESVLKVLSKRSLFSWIRIQLSFNWNTLLTKSIASEAYDNFQRRIRTHEEAVRKQSSSKCLYAQSETWLHHQQRHLVCLRNMCYLQS